MRGQGSKSGSRHSGVTIIRREEVVEAPHHGGAWKVAYADFVTAMMAFFLLMWLLNATTEDQRKGLADYFSPNNLLSHASSGTGQPFGGHTVFDRGAMASDRGAVQVITGKRPLVTDPPEDDDDTPLTEDRHGAAAEAGPAGKLAGGAPGTAAVQPVTPATTGPDASATDAAVAPASQLADIGRPNAAIATQIGNPGTAAAGTAPPGTGIVQATLSAGPAPADRSSSVVARADTLASSRVPTAAELEAEQERREKQAFERAAEELRQAVQADPALAELSHQLAIDITPEGLRIQLLDEERLAMFATGSAAMNQRAQLLLAKVAPILMRLPEQIAVVGHTDATPFAGSGKSNWELSTERANATRRLLTDAGLAEARISRVTGLADRDPLLPADPLAAANRRIAIIVLRGATKAAEPVPLPSAALSAPVPAPLIAAPLAPAPATPQSTQPAVPQAATPSGPPAAAPPPPTWAPGQPVPVRTPATRPP
jgi:chemotaxis protein MotB